MCKSPGFSVFVSQFGGVKDSLKRLYRPGGQIFTSLHVSEEFAPDYPEKARAMCAYLTDIGYSIIADVSKKTLGVFGETDIAEFARRMGIATLRLDYGFSDEETAEIAKKIPVCLNASTMTPESVAKIAEGAVAVYGMHNYYPRPETGLDEEQFDRVNQNLSELGVEVLCFIPGDAALRGPLFQGLPTLEKYRGKSAYASFVDMNLVHRVSSVFVGDGLMSEESSRKIDRFLETGVVELSVEFSPEYRYLDGQSFTVRVDSPRWTLRLQESREYSTPGRPIEPANAIERVPGSVTIDNRLYLRYSGEIQIVRERFPADPKVNVIGNISDGDLFLLDRCANGGRVRFAPSVERDTEK